jgi:hypothetical protein
LTDFPSHLVVNLLFFFNKKVKTVWKEILMVQVLYFIYWRKELDFLSKQENNFYVVRMCSEILHDNKSRAAKLEQFTRSDNNHIFHGIFRCVICLHLWNFFYRWVKKSSAANFDAYLFILLNGANKIAYLSLKYHFLQSCNQKWLFSCHKHPYEAILYLFNHIKLEALIGLHT